MKINTNSFMTLYLIYKKSKQRAYLNAHIVAPNVCQFLISRENDVLFPDRHTVLIETHRFREGNSPEICHMTAMYARFIVDLLYENIEKKL